MAKYQIATAFDKLRPRNDEQFFLCQFIGDLFFEDVGELFQLVKVIATINDPGID